MTQYKLLILQTARQFSGKAWLHYETAFRKDAAASGLSDWSRMNSGLYNIYPLTSTTTVPASYHFILAFLADPGIMAPVPGPMVNVDTVIAVRSVKESIPVLTAPFRPQRRMLSPRGPPPLHGANARGIETVHRAPTTSVSNVNSVQLCCSFSPSNGLFLVPVNVVVSSAHVMPASSRPQGVLGQTLLSSTCLVASTFQKDLVLPSKVTTIDAQKLWRELCFHPDQAKVDYVITGLMSGFRLGFDPSAVSLQSAVQNMPSTSLQPSVIDQYLLPELEKGRVAGPFLISPIPNLHISRFGVIPKKHQLEKWRLILDLSIQVGHSVNDGILKEPFSVQCMKVDDVISGIMSFG